MTAALRQANPLKLKGGLFEPQGVREVDPGLFYANENHKLQESLVGSVLLSNSNRSPFSGIKKSMNGTNMSND